MTGLVTGSLWDDAVRAAEQAGQVGLGAAVHAALQVAAPRFAAMELQRIADRYDTADAQALWSALVLRAEQLDEMARDARGDGNGR